MKKRAIMCDKGGKERELTEKRNREKHIKLGTESRKRGTEERSMERRSEAEPEGLGESIN